MTRPSFILTAAERKMKESGADTFDLIERYVDAFVARFRWKGLPDDCPDDFIERTLFFVGGVGAKKVKGLGPVLMGASGETYTPYGTPVYWLPANVNTQQMPLSADYMKHSKSPVLWDRETMNDKIAPYLEILRKSINALNINMASLAMPIMIESAQGCDFQPKIIRQNLGSGDIFLQCISKGSVPIETIDLKVTDHSQNILSVIHDADSQICSIMAIDSALEKASGMTETEATAGQQQIRDTLRMEYEKRKRWADAVNIELGLQIGVECPYLDSLDADVQAEEEQEGEDALNSE